MSSKEILNDIINNFEPSKFVKFFREKSRKFKPLEQSLSNYNNEDFTNGTILGVISLEDSSEFIIYNFKVINPLSERSGKKAQYILGKKILKEAARYVGGIFIFYDDKGDFRFSLIYDIPLTNGRRDWSNFKRFTFYLSKYQTNKTFISRLDGADFSSLGKIKEAFSVEKVTKEFYTEIVNWYFWALKNVKFPKDAEVEKNGKNIALIRFITRIIFIWFMKHKKLVTNALFDKDEIKNIVKTQNVASHLTDNDGESTYYKAILQNLFFATLNTPTNERKFRRDRTFQGKNDHYMEHNYYRYHSLFYNPEDMLNIFRDIPFLNGGLFECLDKSKNDPSNDTGEEIRIDGYSDKENNQTTFPNFLFFSDEKEVDLNKDYGTAKKKYKARGLLNILQSYNFTIDENTPTDEEIALDPELLGRVFENLLASYNPETASTARKSTGSYYTPREIVNYMVDESLIAYLKNKMIEGAKSFIRLGTDQSDMFGNSARKGQLLIEEELLPSRWNDNEDKLENELRKLVSYSENSISFADKETDILINAINNCKILDPAVGSGAFPMGVLHKLVLILSKIDPHNTKWKQQQISAIETNVTDPKLKQQLTDKIEENFNRNELDYGRKLYLIQNCLYGVDIQPIAIQISKLRFFISLLVDEKVVKTQNIASQSSGADNYGIEPLPNLETKLVAANTLIGLPESLRLKPREIEKLEEELFALRKKYFIISSETEKKTLEAKDRELRQQLKKLLDEKGFPSEFAEKISKWDPYNTNVASSWFNPEWMFGPDVKNGFDIVIGNPPYVEHKKLKNISSLLKVNYNTYSGTADLYVYFYENGIKHLRENGTLIFITSNKFIKTSYGENLRKHFTAFRINEIIDFTDVHVFEALVASCIFSISKNKTNDNKIRIAFANDTLTNFSGVSTFIEHNKFYLSQNGLSEKIWQLENETKLALKEKIENGSITFNKTGTVKIFRGVTTGYNPAFIINDEKRKELLDADRENKAIIKPLLQGRNIRKWVSNKSNTFLLQTGFDKDIKKKYPSILKHLNSFKQELEVRADQGVNYWNLRACKYYSEFEKEKIIWGLTSDKWTFAYDDEKNYLPSNGYILTSTEIPIKYLLALMNSKVMEFYFGYIGIMTAGGAYTLKYETVIEFPIKNISFSNQQPFIELVDKILLIKKQNPQDDTKQLEDQIDIMVYKLYNLTYEEVEIVDPQIGSIISKEDYDKFQIQ